MSHPTKCDVCGRTNDSPDVVIDKKRRVNWWQSFGWWEGEMWEKLDICDYCWEGWRSFMQNRLASKTVNQ